MRSFGAAECRFHYRESIFKEHKDWIILDVELAMTQAPAAELRQTADEIFKIRLAKYPATMKCAGSIFKNLILAELPESVRRQIPDRVVREGKAPSAYFLEQVGAKGMRSGGIHVADYHANLIYNAGRRHGARIVRIDRRAESTGAAPVRPGTAGRSAVRRLLAGFLLPCSGWVPAGLIA